MDAVFFFFFFFLEFAGEVIQHGSHEQRGDAVNNQYGLKWLIGGMALSRLILSLDNLLVIFMSSLLKSIF